MTSATVGAIDIVAWFVYLFSAVLFCGRSAFHEFAEDRPQG
mgnify:CR=1 FL=1